MINYRKIYKENTGITWQSSKYEVHHIDGNRENNKFSNLILLPKTIHKRFHKLYNKIQYIKPKNVLDIEVNYYIDQRENICEFIKIKNIIFCCLQVKNTMSSKDYMDYIDAMEKVYGYSNN